MITFLNKDWIESYGGHSEFWNLDMTQCIQRTLPVFNRVLIFEVGNTTWHGHPDPLSCPDNRCRKSLASYYYTLHDHDISDLEYRSSDYKKRPHEETDPKIESLRKKRRKGRLEDLIT